jgi:hypothetical protein
MTNSDLSAIRAQGRGRAKRQQGFQRLSQGKSGSDFYKLTAAVKA